MLSALFADQKDIGRSFSKQKAHRCHEFLITDEAPYWKVSIMKHYTGLIGLLTLMLYVSGCHFGSAALPIVSTTPVPNTQFKIHLGGPDTQGDYGYYITSVSGKRFFSHYRTLGPLQPGQTTPENLESMGNGVYRIQWGEGPASVFAVIDFEKALFVEDSNTSNPRNEPLERQ